jgi:hypothetical protein
MQQQMADSRYPTAGGLLAAAKLHFFLEIVIPATTAAEPADAVHRLVAVPAASLGLEQHQGACIARLRLCCHRMEHVLFGTCFYHVVLLIPDPGAQK